MAIGESYLYRKYKVPLAVHIVDLGGSTTKSLWKEWHSAAKYRQSLVAEMNLENYVSALSQCPDVLRENFMVDVQFRNSICWVVLGRGVCH